MTDGPTNPTPGGMPGAPVSLVERVKNILTTPKTEWARIDAEPATIGGIFTSYVLILAAIGPIAMLVGQQLFGVGGFGFTWKPPIAYSVGSAVLTYLLSLAAVYVSSLVIDALAPSFGGTKDPVKAFKVAAYAATPGWVAGIFNIIPMLAWLALIGALYGLYLLYLGLPRLMRVSEDKAVGYTVVVVVVQIVLYFVAAFLVGMLVLSFFGAAMMTAPVTRY
ncbi:MAG TPA: Yip1 family protein [Allosphingosinicella sp.]|nr:Yip1 family protein [Allosphingosinicella sp.]